MLILLFFPIITLLAGALARTTGAMQQPFDLIGAVNALMNPATLVGTMVFTLVIGPLPEEIGWRGYLFNHAQTRWSALSASIFVGIVNWLWHLPLFYLPGYSDAFRTVPPSMFQMFFIVVPVGVLYAWAYNNTRRSVLAAILLHFGGNFWGEFFGISAEAQTYRIILTIIIVIFIVWWWRPATLQREAKPAIAH